MRGFEDKPDWITHSKPDISEADRLAVEKVLRNGMLASGAEALAFAEELAARYGYRYALCCGSGAQALSLILAALNVGRGDEVIAPAYVCHSVADAVMSVGALPVFCDVDESGLMTAGDVKRQITKKTRAVIAVHIFGLPCDTRSICALGLPVIEDFAQRLGRGGVYGNDSAAGFFSFHPTKCLTAGMGGMLALNDGSLFSRIRGEMSSRILPLPDMNAALGRSQLARYDGMLDRRERIAARYFKELDGQWLNTMRRYAKDSMFYRFCIRRAGVRFEQAQECFAAECVHVRRGVDELLHIRYKTGQSLPVAERLFSENISLPIYPALTEEELKRVIKAAKKI